MEKWEYYVTQVQLNESYQASDGKNQALWTGYLPDGTELPLRSLLRRLGDDGWEMVGTAQLTSLPNGWNLHHLYFKRPNG